MEPVTYKISLTTSLEFEVLADSAEQALNYYKREDNFVFYYCMRGKHCKPRQAMDRADVIRTKEIDQDSVKVERIFSP